MQFPTWGTPNLAVIWHETHFTANLGSTSHGISFCEYFCSTRSILEIFWSSAQDHLTKAGCDMNSYNTHHSNFGQTDLYRFYFIQKYINITLHKASLLYCHQLMWIHARWPKQAVIWSAFHITTTLAKPNMVVSKYGHLACYKSSRKLAESYPDGLRIVSWSKLAVINYKLIVSPPLWPTKWNTDNGLFRNFRHCHSSSFCLPKLTKAGCDMTELHISQPLGPPRKSTLDTRFYTGIVMSQSFKQNWIETSWPKQAVIWI